MENNIIGWPKITEDEAHQVFKDVFVIIDEYQGKGMPTPEDGSRLRGDDLHMNPYHVSHYAQMSIMGAIDHLSAIRSLIEVAKIGHISAPYTLLRGVLEMSAAAILLLCPQDQKARIGNRVTFMSQELRDSGSLIKDEGMDKAPVLERHKSILERHESRMVKIRRNNTWMDAKFEGKYKSGSKIMEEASLLVSSDKRYLTAWRWCSGMAHGRSWTNLSMSMMEPLEKVDVNVGRYVVTSDTGLVASMSHIAAEMLTHAIEAYKDNAIYKPFNPLLLSKSTSNSDSCGRLNPIFVI